MLVENDNVEKGEYCLVADISAVPVPPPAGENKLSAELFILNEMLKGAEMRDACASANIAGYARNDVYKAKLCLQEFLDSLIQE